MDKTLVFLLFCFLLIPHVSKAQESVEPPTNIRLTDQGYYDLSFAWSPSKEPGDISYRLILFSRNDSREHDVRDITDTTYTFSDLGLGLRYQFSIWTYNSDGYRSDQRDIQVNTKSFDTNAWYDFERNDLDDWNITSGEASISDSVYHSGLQSVKIITSGSDTQFKLPTDLSADNIYNGSIQPGHILSYQLWFPETEKEKVKSIELYSEFGSGEDSSRTSTFYRVNDSVPNNWHEIFHEIPSSTEDLKAVGIQIHNKNAYKNDPVTYFLDFITTNPAQNIAPELSIPDNLSVYIDSTGYYHLSWSPSKGPNNQIKEEGECIYYIYRKRVGGEFEFVGSSIDTTYSSGIYNTTFELYVTALNEEYNETQASQIISVTHLEVSTEPESGNPFEFTLFKNYPNPFNPGTVIRYQLPVNSLVSLKVFDLLGREVAVLVNGRKSAGNHEVTFDASGLSSGVYIYRLESGSFIQTQRMTLIK